jgi:hypothetical protein
MAVVQSRKMNELRFIEIFNRYDPKQQSDMLTTLSEIFRVHNEKERRNHLNAIKRKYKI